MDPREKAQEHLTGTGGETNALKGIGWALLDLADAIRDAAPPPATQLVLKATGFPKPPDPPPPGRNPATGEPARGDRRPFRRSR